LATRVAAALLLALALGPIDARALDDADEHAWREQALAFQRDVESAEQALRLCEEREAPDAYQGVGGYWERGRRGPRWVEVVSCDEQRVALDDARRALDDFEETARRRGVPPGWLR
jgi:hypothetical protein